MRRKTLLAIIVMLSVGLTCLAQDAKPPKPKKVPASQVRGQPEIKADQEVAVFIWSDKEGIHLRWTSGKEPVLIQGRIDADKPIKDHKRIMELGSGFVEASGDRILMFSTTLRKGIDGIDLQVPGSKRFQLELHIDGKEPLVEQVHFGKGMTPPKGFPLLIYI